MKTGTACNLGFTLVELMIVVGLISVLAVIAIPNFVHARTNSQKTTCLNNLRQIDAAVQEWAAEQKKGPSATPDFTDISVYLKNVVICPGGGTTFSDSYELWEVTNRPTCKKVPDHTLPADIAS